MCICIYTYIYVVCSTYLHVHELPLVTYHLYPKSTESRSEKLSSVQLLLLPTFGLQKNGLEEALKRMAPVMGI